MALVQAKTRKGEIVELNDDWQQAGGVLSGVMSRLKVQLSVSNEDSKDRQLSGDQSAPRKAA